jgi:hypothetical protein
MNTKRPFVNLPSQNTIDELLSALNMSLSRFTDSFLEISFKIQSPNRFLQQSF